jgi:DNA (cytosine-5)-methyltransferase 1
VHKLNFIDIFAGAGGLSEGFIRAGYKPLAHIEMDKYACDTLRTRSAYHYLKEENKLDIYINYLKEKKEGESGQKLWNQIPDNLIDSVINEEISDDTLSKLFKKIDVLKGKEKIDIIIGGPPCQAYSVAGRARMGKNVENDPRN